MNYPQRVMKLIRLTLWNCDEFWTRYFRSVLRAKPVELQRINSIDEFQPARAAVRDAMLCDIPVRPDGLVHCLWEAERRGRPIASLVMVDRSARCYWRELRKFGVSLVLARPVIPSQVAELISRLSDRVK